MRYLAFLLLILCTALSAESLHVDKILIQKSERTLSLISGDKTLKTFHISLGSSPTGPKRAQGDGKTPEGTYKITSRNTHSGYHKSLELSYPNENDKKASQALGVNPGGQIMIHGLKNGLGWLSKIHRFYDWTKGCIALTNEEMDEIWPDVPVGTIVEIQP